MAYSVAVFYCITLSHRASQLSLSSPVNQFLMKEQRLLRAVGAATVTLVVSVPVGVGVLVPVPLVDEGLAADAAGEADAVDRGLVVVEAAHVLEQVALQQEFLKCVYHVKEM